MYVVLSRYSNEQKQAKDWIIQANGREFSTCEAAGNWARRNCVIGAQFVVAEIQEWYEAERTVNEGAFCE